MSRVNTASDKRDKIFFLEELHRPLEEHWSQKKNSTRLDPKTSDYIYKHHVSHLEEIYSNQKPNLKDNPRSLIMSPVTQLYGVHGLKTDSPEVEEKIKERETNWVSNFQIHHPLDSKKKKSSLNSQTSKKAWGNMYTEQQMNRSMKGIRPQSAPIDKKSPQSQPDDILTSHTSRRTYNDNLSSSELITFGVYRFDPEQAEVYNKFVDMISQFDTFDMQNIVEDALNDAQHEEIFDEFDGTS